MGDALTRLPKDEKDAKIRRMGFRMKFRMEIIEGIQMHHSNLKKHRGLDNALGVWLMFSTVCHKAA